MLFWVAQLCIIVYGCYALRPSLEPWTYLDFTWVTCKWEHKCQTAQRLPKLDPSSPLLQTLGNFWMWSPPHHVIHSVCLLHSGAPASPRNKWSFSSCESQDTFSLCSTCVKSKTTHNVWTWFSWHCVEVICEKGLREFLCPSGQCWCVLPVILQLTSWQRRSTRQDSRLWGCVPRAERLLTHLFLSWLCTTRPVTWTGNT